MTRPHETNVVRPSAPQSPDLDQDDFAYLQDLLRRRTGVVLDSGREPFAAARIASVARQEGLGSNRELLDSLQTEEEWGYLHRQVVEALLVTETSFFRDRHPFDALRSHFLPMLVAAREKERSLKIWCAACASGQEPYSVAMLIREYFPTLLSWDLRIIASDVSETMLERARGARYSQIEVNRGLPAPLLVKNFEKTEKDWRVRDSIRRMVEFREINLADPLPGLPHMDLVLLRNLLIYFAQPTRQATLRQVASVLRSDGILILGGGETTLTMDPTFRPTMIDRAIGYRLAA